MYTYQELKSVNNGPTRIVNHACKVITLLHLEGINEEWSCMRALYITSDVLNYKQVTIPLYIYTLHIYTVQVTIYTKVIYIQYK